jgi:hypothetical protein
VRTAILSLGLTAIALYASAADFTRASSFDSIAAFVAAAKSFQPATTKSDLAALFTVRESGQPEDRKTGTPVTAPTIQSATELWSIDSQALVFVAAAPPTDATRSSVGALFLLAHQRGSWRIADLLRFSATGKYAEVSAELTADAGTGYRLGSEGMATVVTIKESHGWRGYSYLASASYILNNSKLERLELK